MVEGATARVWPRVLCPPPLCVPHLQAPFSSVGINSCAGAAGERGFGYTEGRDWGCFCAVPVARRPAGCGGGSAHCERLLGMVSGRHRGAQTTHLRGWLCPVPGWVGTVLWGLPWGSGCAPGLRAGPCSAVSVQCVAECQLSFRAEMPLASHQRWRSGTVLEEVQ